MLLFRKKNSNSIRDFSYSCQETTSIMKCGKPDGLQQIQAVVKFVGHLSNAPNDAKGPKELKAKLVFGLLSHRGLHTWL